jgi:DNA (cytosine-5)-methyltransferase 1
MENVVHMRPWSRYPELKAKLGELGYHYDEHVLDSSDFGVPQRRRRLFLVADRKRQPPTLRVPNRLIERTASDILDPSGTWPTRPLLTKTRAKATLERAKRAWKALGKEARFLLVYYGTDGCGGWQPLDKPLRTVTTIDRFALVEPGDTGPTIRMLQVPELARAMGLPNNYAMPIGTRRDKIRLLGNGVCPPVMRELLRQLTAL